MKKQMHRLLSLMLSLILVVGLIPGSLMTAHAAEATEITSVDITLPTDLLGEAPGIEDFTLGSSNYTIGSADWYPFVGSDSVSTLQNNEVYSLWLSFYPASGYAFDESNPPTINVSGVPADDINFPEVYEGVFWVEVVVRIGTPTPYCIDFRGDGGSGEYFWYFGNGDYTLPEYMYTLEGYVSKAWKIDGVEYQPGDVIQLNEDKTASPVWVRDNFTIQVVGGTADKTECAYARSVTITANDPEPGKRFKEWTGIDGLNISIGDKNSTSITFFMPARNVIVTAVYEDDTYNNIMVNGGTADKTKAEPGEIVTITANEPAAGKQFAGWATKDGVTFADATKVTTTFVMPAKDVRVDATYEDKLPEKYKVQVVGGTPDKLEAAPGETVTITAYEPASGKQFAKWTTEDGVTFADATKATTTFVMPAKNVRVDATYEDKIPDKYSVQVVGGTADKTEYAPGETVTITANPPASGKQFAKWTTADGVTFADATKATTTFVMPAKNVRVDATYEDKNPDKYSVQVVGGNADKTEYAPGETVTITANPPASGKQFAKWTTTDGVTFADATKATTTFVMPAKNVRVDATYEDKLPEKYKVQVVGGTPDKQEAAPGEAVTITAYEPASGKQFAKWTTEDGVTFADATKATTTFVMPEGDVRVDAVFEDLPATYHVMVVGGTPDKYEAKAGETITITAYEAADGTKFGGWTVTSNDMFVAVELADATKATTTFVMPEGDVRVAAVSENLPAIYHVMVVGGTPDKYEAKAGETITITAYEAADGKKFAGWTITTNEMFVAVELADATKATTTFVMPEGDVRVDAVFGDLPTTYHVTVVGGTPDKHEAKAGETITITAYEAADGKKFAGWAITTNEMFVAVELADATKATTTFVMPEGDVRVDAIFEDEVTPPAGDGDNNNDGGSNLWWLWVLIAIVVVGGGIAIFVFVKKKKQQ